MLSGTIQRASSWPVYKIPDFMNILTQYNKTATNKVSSLVLGLSVNSRDDVKVVSAQITPSLPEFNGMLQQIKENVPKYFSKNYETLNGVPAGSYTATYTIPVPEGTGISNRQL